MKLFYYKDEVGNFGDDLNPWLWEKLLPDFFDGDDSEWLVGIGTLLNHRLPVTGKKYVLGSGYGYGKPPSIDADFHFFCVRGPKTAEVLHLPPSLALTDSAILLRAVAPPKPERPRYKFGFIPHYQSSRYFSWEKVCERLGFNYICAEWSVDRVFSEIQNCEVMLCEAMHGAIASDALRVPWIPIRCYDYISAFKWEDWLATVHLPYEPRSVTSVYDCESRMPAAEQRKNKLKRVLQSTGIWSDRWRSPGPANSSEVLIEQATKDLMAAASTKVFLSADAICESLTSRYLEILEQVKQLKK